jgi:imidazolonepropionase-like amidohydrolase
MPDPVFDGEDQARAAARRMIRAGADWLKVCATGSALGPAARYDEITVGELAALVDEAARRGQRRVMAHAHGARGAETAARAGARSIEHGLYLDEAAVEVMREHGTWLVPTLSASHGGGALDPDVAEVHRASVRLALDADVPIAMGTDCPMRPHQETLKEIGYLADAGLGAAGAVRAATYDAARLLEIDAGEIAPGKPADLVLLRATPGADPLGDVTDLTERIRAVWRGGRQVSPTGPLPI